jgi:hypothetical protein
MTTDQGKSADFYFDTERAVPLKIVTQTSEGKTKREAVEAIIVVLKASGCHLALKTLEDKELTDNASRSWSSRVNTGVGDEQFEKP